MPMWMDVDTAVVVPMNIMPLIQAADFKTIEQAFVYNMAGIAVQWNFVTTAGVMTTVAITPTTGGSYDISEPLANVGMYAIEIPASGGASANNDTEGFGWITGSSTAVLPFRGPIIGFRRAALNDLLIDGGTASTNLEDMFDGTGYAGGTARLKTDLDTIKTQAVTCAAGVTIRADVGHAGVPGAENGAPYVAAGGAKLAQTVDLTAGQTIPTVTTLTNPVTLANGAHGGAAATITTSSGELGAITLGIKVQTDPLATGAVVTDGGNSATTFKTNLASAVDNYYNRCLLRITSGALIGQVDKISDYDGTNKIVTLQTGFTGTPADDVTFAVENQ